MKNKQNPVFRVTFGIVLISAICTYFFLIFKNGMSLLNSLKIAPLPVAWSGFVLSALLLLWFFVQKIILKKENATLKSWGAVLLGMTSAPLMLAWLILMIQSFGQRTQMEELIFPVLLFTGLTILSIFRLKKRNSSSRSNVILLILAIVVFVLPRENGDLEWNLNQSFRQWSTDTTSQRNVNSFNWGDQSVYPGDYGAVLVLDYNGIGGKVGNILKDHYATAPDLFPDNAVFVNVSGTISSAGISPLVPLVKTGAVRAQLNVGITYNLNNADSDSDSNSGENRYLTYTSNLNLAIDMKQTVIGISSIHEYHKLLALEIHKEIIAKAEDELLMN